MCRHNGRGRVGYLLRNMDPGPYKKRDYADNL